MKMEAGLVTQRHINNHEFREFTRINISFDNGLQGFNGLLF